MRFPTEMEIQIYQSLRSDLPPKKYVVTSKAYFM